MASTLFSALSVRPLVTYQPFQEVIFECSAILEAERAWVRTLSFPLKPISLVDSLTDPSKLPKRR